MFILIEFYFCFFFLHLVMFLILNHFFHCEDFAKFELLYEKKWYLFSKSHYFLKISGIHFQNPLIFNSQYNFAQNDLKYSWLDNLNIKMHPFVQILQIEIPDFLNLSRRSSLKCISVGLDDHRTQKWCKPKIPLVHEWDFKFWPKSHRGQKRN